MNKEPKKFTYFVSYSTGFGFGFTSLVMDYKIDNWEQLMIVKKTIENYEINKNLEVVILNFILLKEKDTDYELISKIGEKQDGN